MGDDEHDLPTPGEIVDVTGGDPAKIRDGMRAFGWVNGECPSASENIDVTPGVGRDIRAPPRDYTGQDWHFEQEFGDEAGEGE
ncbi:MULTISPECIES: hypothetical protein [unclassified Haloarcula]|uniref:hypothetical protein n=1 Tax=unclassified Haloarcula TaxID=2624677 RepID=UPI000EF217EB|nr:MULTISPECIES: hypothetical protein [unclassified Haloarcula]